MPVRQSLCGSRSFVMPDNSSQRDRLREDAQFRILRMLHENPEMTQRDLARAVGVSTGGMHYVLSALVEKGLLKFSNFRASDDKRRYAYVLTPKGVAAKADLTRKFLIRKLAEYELLKAEIDAVKNELSDAEFSDLKGLSKRG